MQAFLVVEGNLGKWEDTVVVPETLQIEIQKISTALFHGFHYPFTKFSGAMPFSTIELNRPVSSMSVKVFFQDDVQKKPWFKINW